ncbi:hypothetical protein SAMN06297229_1711 [Pseudidiomarina planktonica]|uniref:Glutathione S-transferase n=1 Tax=Pseudidiomarina planktonica TaxID=1323738 RepID=A0A1Y6F2G6_9GAMM|nr:MAPEG family protein [Pseudidiomarina planktonica]RUO64957.1 glutathione S-transferase [Pseudidiomarina planktonica]SMQ68769.1 hypothetical protein SAMN06297229_1711 [Pseudidiomarina planktonica]
MTLVPPVISLLYIALLTLLLLVLSGRIIRLRWRDRIGMGIGDSKDLEVAVRIHGNFIEYVPLALLILVMMEMTGANAMLLHGLGALLFIARVCHAMGLTRSVGVSWPRTVGVLGTFAMLLLSAGYLLGYYLGQTL